MSDVAYDVSKAMDTIEDEAKRQLALFGGLSDNVGRALLAHYLGAKENHQMARQRAADAVRHGIRFGESLRTALAALEGANAAIDQMRSQGAPVDTWDSIQADILYAMRKAAMTLDGDEPA